MKVSHKYTADEVASLVPAERSTEVLDAVKSIYSGLPSASLTIAIPAREGKTASTLKVTFEDSSNPKDNIVGYALLTEGVNRVHPGGYVALFSAAIEANVSSINVTSCWRPLLGSIAHRAGLGLDVNYVGANRMNRKELRAPKGNGKDGDNVSDLEVTLFQKYESALKENQDATKAQKAARLAVLNAKGDPNALVEAKKKLKDAESAAQVTEENEVNSRKAWDDERGHQEPHTVQRFRASLLKCACVFQLYDPWLMDNNTRDGVDPTPNMQRPTPSGKGQSNEELHANHLHVTVHEPKIL
jgi:hypothetical protein